MKLAAALCLFSVLGFSQANRVTNFSFEQAGSLPNLAAGWTPAWNGYTRVAMSPTATWDGSYALSLSGPSNVLLGAVQRIDLNQTLAVPILITMQVKGSNIADVSADAVGASFDCRVKFVGVTTLSYCPTTAKTKNVGTFDWRLVGVNTTDLVNGQLPIEWLEVRLRRGAASGTAWFDDVHVAEYPSGTFNGAVTFMFDDGYKEHITFVKPSLAGYGWKGVEAAVSNYVQSGDPGYCTISDILALQNAGWEIVSHSVSHADLTTLTPTAMEDQLYWSRKYFLDHGVNTKAFALPFGAYNAFVLGLNEERGYYNSMRNTDRGFNPMGAFPHNIKVQAVNYNVTLIQVQDWLAEARTRKAWLILMFHKVRPVCNNDTYCVSQSMFGDILSTVKGTPLPVVTYQQGLSLVHSPVPF